MYREKKTWRCIGQSVKPACGRFGVQKRSLQAEVVKRNESSLVTSLVTGVNAPGSWRLQ